MNMKAFLSLAALLAGLGALPVLAADDPLVERGRYLVRTAGCNDCHTAGYMEKSGAVPEQDWLQGDRIGWRGPWGTTYAVNLRLYMEPLSEAQWLTIARHKPARPPMPWWSLRDMSDQDLRALYRYIRRLGPAGSSAPGFVPPDQEPATPYIVMVPQAPAGAGAAGATPPPKTQQDREDGRLFDWSFKPARPRTDRP
jgi:mono/diheme cytochrome c family protein